MNTNAVTYGVQDDLHSPVFQLLARTWYEAELPDLMRALAYCQRRYNDLLVDAQMEPCNGLTCLRIRIPGRTKIRRCHTGACPSCWIQRTATILHRLNTMQTEPWTSFYVRTYDLPDVQTDDVGRDLFLGRHWGRNRPTLIAWTTVVGDNGDDLEQRALGLWAATERPTMPGYALINGQQVKPTAHAVRTYVDTPDSVIVTERYDQADTAVEVFADLLTPPMLMTFPRPLSNPTDDELIEQEDRIQRAYALYGRKPFGQLGRCSN